MMLNRPDHLTARDALLQAVRPLSPQRLPLADCAGLVLAEDLVAKETVPAFDRSPYDGYALRGQDTQRACKAAPVQLKVLEEVAAGQVPTRTCAPGTAIRIMTGAPIPQGADAVIMYERTEFTQEWVKVFEPVQAGENIVKVGEDVRQGQLLAGAGSAIDAGTLGTLAAQGEGTPLVYRRPKVGVLSTGSELVEVDQPLRPGMIYNSNRYTISAALESIGCQPVFLGTAGDSVQDICALFEHGLAQCDAVVSTGGVYEGDYDLTPDAMEQAGVEMLIRGVRLKPGMACAYGLREGKPVCALSGNPASSLTNFYVIAAPALRRLAGLAQPAPEEITVTLLDPFPKKSKGGRVLRGRLELADGAAGLRIGADQGNVVLSSTIGCNVMAFVPVGSGPLEAGTQLKGFLL
ncbi:MAG: molybdopterin molybdotransferase MoeA [Oscillospiraceae bacterium]|nr:molybdopterin molybdotransferase MoeA [Oscillospiraceae bacterium]